MYYPDEVVEEVLRSNNIVDVVSSYVHLKKQGSNYFGLCPFHNEKTGSFSVSEPKQMFYCFGCGAGGNAATFLMKYENYSFQEALQTLADRAGIKLPEVNYSEEARKREEHRKLLMAVNKETAIYYYKLLRSPKGRKGLAYLVERQLTPETIHAFGLGFADGAGNDLVAHLRSKGFSDDVILEAGVAVFDEKRGIHDKFWNRVMFPIQDLRGQVIGFGGRVMGDAKPKYLNSPETAVFDKSRNLYGLHLAKRSKANEWILCEGYMDVIAMHQAGFTQAVASLGTSFTEGQAALLKRYVTTVCLAYDSDEAGVRASRRGIGILDSAGINAKVINMRPAKDPDEFMKRFGKEAFRERIRDAENSFFFEVRMMEGQYRMDDPAQRTAFHRAIAGKLCAFEDEIERDNYIREVCARYRISEEALRKSVASYRRVGGGNPSYGRAGVTDSSYGKSGGGNPRRQQSVLDGQGDGNIPGDNPGGEQRRRNERKDTAAGRAQRCLLTWIADEPSVLTAVRPYVGAEDFDEGILRKTAEYLFGALESGAGQGCVAAVIGQFADEKEQEAAAGIFQEHLKGITEKRDRERALRDLVYTVKNDAFRRLMQSPEPPSMEEMLRAKRELEKAGQAKFAL